MSTSVLPSFGASHTIIEGVKSEMNDKSDQKLVFGDSPLLWQSPWILPAYVVSNERDAEKRPIVQIAKCTIDTGNMQGNIVSRRLVELLGFTSSTFEKLTEVEERGGSGITGDQHTPQGAIYLTWYHNNSTRVFRDMRFLISPSESCDLIIGAWSVQKDKILDVPCLMAIKKPCQRDAIIFNPAQLQEDALLQELHDIYRQARAEWIDRQNDEKGNKDDDDKPILVELVRQTEAEVDVSGWLLDVYQIYKKGENAKNHDADDIWKELDVIWYTMRAKPFGDVQSKLEKFYDLLTKKLDLKDNRKECKIKI